MDIPPNLRWLGGLDGGRAWLDSLEDRVRGAADRWDLELGPVFPGAFVSYTCPAVGPDGVEVVLKVQYPHEDCRAEADALAAWDGRGAVRLLHHDAGRWAMVLERCTPGVVLDAAGIPGADVLGVVADLTEQTWVVPRPDHTFATLEAHARSWPVDMEERWANGVRTFPRPLVDLAIACLAEVVDGQGEQVIVNQDLHGENVISAERLPWLVIDPKPLVGERELSAASLLRWFGYVHTADETAEWFDRLCERLHLDRGRALRWAIGQTVCWGMESQPAVSARHAQTVAGLAEVLRARG